MIYDTVEVIARRVVRRESPFQASREHLHHVFLLAGFSISETVLTMGAIAAIGVAVGVASAFVTVPDSILFGAFILFGLLFLRMIFRTWSVMQFLYRSICRRRGERRVETQDSWQGIDRRSGKDRRSQPRSSLKMRLDLGDFDPSAPSRDRAAPPAPRPFQWDPSIDSLGQGEPVPR